MADLRYFFRRRRTGVREDPVMMRMNRSGEAGKCFSALLLDDVIQDGRDYTVLTVRTDAAAQTVEYCYLHEYDCSPHREALAAGGAHGGF